MQHLAALDLDYVCHGTGLWLIDAINMAAVHAVTSEALLNLFCGPLPANVYHLVSGRVWSSNRINTQ
jgi:hypothetical protein